MKENNKFPHQPVLLTQVIEAFDGCNLSVFVDGTLGAGGHAEAILTKHPEIDLYIGIDQDPLALEIAEKRLDPWKEKIQLFHTNFSDFYTCMVSLGHYKCQGILVDLGVSSMQLDLPERGFSYGKEGPLDMRMNPENDLTAFEIINHWSEWELGRIFRDYGEEERWRSAARMIAESRKQGDIKTTTQLAEILRPVFASKMRKGINPLTLVFQGLRIAVNRELDILEPFVEDAIEVLETGGRLAVISFHSLEDRIIKNGMREAASDKWNTSGIGGVFLDKDPLVKLLHRKPLIASDAEVAENPRSRSAKLRVAERI